MKETRLAVPTQGRTRLRATLAQILVAVPLMAAVVWPAPSQAEVAVGISVGIAPPALPVYVQPPVPGAGYIWTPGYWAWSGDDYYWVPGTWVLPPTVGVLWTPSWWGWSDGVYVFHPGYWGQHIGFYGGIDYGFGYTGVGYVGGYWDHDRFFYNRAVNNVRDVHITNVYNSAVVNHVNATHVSYNGGPGGVAVRPTAADERLSAAPHMQPTAVQQQHAQLAASNRELFAKANGGHPPIAATQSPGRFEGPGVVAARGATVGHTGPTSGAAVQGARAAQHGAAHPPYTAAERVQAAHAGHPLPATAPHGAGSPQQGAGATREESARVAHPPAATAERMTHTPSAAQGSHAPVPRPAGSTARMNSSEHATASRPAPAARPAPSGHAPATPHAAAPSHGSAPEGGAAHEEHR